MTKEEYLRRAHEADDFVGQLFRVPTKQGEAYFSVEEMREDGEIRLEHRAEFTNYKDYYYRDGGWFPSGKIGAMILLQKGFFEEEFEKIGD